MRLFRRNKGQDEGGAAVLDRPQVKLPDKVDDDFKGTTDELFSEIERLTFRRRGSTRVTAARRLTPAPDVTVAAEGT